jgi:hypothetical protein
MPREIERTWPTVKLIMIFCGVKATSAGPSGGFWELRILLL